MPFKEYLHAEGEYMGKISQKSSYKNIRTAAKSSKFFIDKQASKEAEVKIVKK